jgi:hypothetical protein
LTVGEKNDERMNAAIDHVGACAPAVGSVWRHNKGGVYRVVANALREDDLVPLVVYRGEYPQGGPFVGKLAVCWARPLAEFNDGRFTMVAPGPAKEGG